MDRKPSALEQWRLDNGKTQAELADLLGTTQATISRWETGESPITPTVALAIAAATGVPREKLLARAKRVRGAAA